MIDFLRWYADIFSTQEGRIGFLVVAYIIAFWIAGIEIMIKNKKAEAKKKKQEEKLDKFN